MSLNPLDIIKIPFKIGEKISRPVMDIVENAMGKDVDTFLESLPGGKMLQNATGSFNEWFADNKPRIVVDAKTGEEATEVKVEE